MKSVVYQSSALTMSKFSNKAAGNITLSYLSFSCYNGTYYAFTKDISIG